MSELADAGGKPVPCSKGNPQKRFILGEDHFAAAVGHAGKQRQRFGGLRLPQPRVPQLPQAREGQHVREPQDPQRGERRQEHAAEDEGDGEVLHLQGPVHGLQGARDAVRHGLDLLPGVLVLGHGLVRDGDGVDAGRLGARRLLHRLLPHAAEQRRVLLAQAPAGGGDGHGVDRGRQQRQHHHRQRLVGAVHQHQPRDVGPEAHAKVAPLPHEAEPVGQGAQVREDGADAREVRLDDRALELAELVGQDVAGALGGDGGGLLAEEDHDGLFAGPERHTGSLGRAGGWAGARKQRIQSSHMPPCHRRMVIATNLSSLFELLHCGIPQTRAGCCLEFIVVSGYRMFLGLSASALLPLIVPVRRAMQGSPPISQHQKGKITGSGGGGGGSRAPSPDIPSRRKGLHGPVSDLEVPWTADVRRAARGSFATSATTGRLARAL